MATKILPHNFGELLQAQIAILEKREFNLVPDFIQGGLIDPAEYDDGRGKVKVRARIEVEGDKRIVIREIPFSTTTESLINSIETATQKGKLKVSSINDFTSEDVEIELTLPQGFMQKRSFSSSMLTPIVKSQCPPISSRSMAGHQENSR